MTFAYSEEPRTLDLTTYPSAIVRPDDVMVYVVDGEVALSLQWGDSDAGQERQLEIRFPLGSSLLSAIAENIASLPEPAQ